MKKRTHGRQKKRKAKSNQTNIQATKARKQKETQENKGRSGNICTLHHPLQLTIHVGKLF